MTDTEVNLTTLMTTARGLVDTPEKWIRGHYAKNADGQSVDFGSGGTCFCISGAVHEAVYRVHWYEVVKHLDPERSGRFNFDTPWDILRESVKRTYNYTMGSMGSMGSTVIDIIGFNDDSGTTHEQILVVFDKAIELAREYDEFGELIVDA